MLQRWLFRGLRNASDEVPHYIVPHADFPQSFSILVARTEELQLATQNAQREVRYPITSTAILLHPKLPRGEQHGEITLHVIG